MRRGVLGGGAQGRQRRGSTRPRDAGLRGRGGGARARASLERVGRTSRPGKRRSRTRAGIRGRPWKSADALSFGEAYGALARPGGQERRENWLADCGKRTRVQSRFPDAAATRRALVVRGLSGLVRMGALLPCCLDALRCAALCCAGDHVWMQLRQSQELRLALCTEASAFQCSREELPAPQGPKAAFDSHCAHVSTSHRVLHVSESEQAYQDAAAAQTRGFGRSKKAVMQQCIRPVLAPKDVTTLRQHQIASNGQGHFPTSIRRNAGAFEP